MTKESKANIEMFDRLMETTDRDEAIQLATKLFPDMTEAEIMETVDEALSGYREA